METLGRRGFLQGALAGAGLVAGAAQAETTPPENAPRRKRRPRFQNGASPFPLLLNTSTIRPASLLEKIDATAAAGYDGIELWIDDLEKHEKDGNSLKDLAKYIQDKGLYVHNVIGLWNAVPPTQEAWEAHLPETRNRMRMMSEAGSRHAAAIPDSELENIDLKWTAAKYKELLDIGRNDYNIIPAFEFVGFFKSINRLGTASAIALDANDPDACLIADTFHLFRGGSGFNGVQMLQGKFICNFHWNDIAASQPAESAADEHRIFPGDGHLPLVQLLKDLRAIRYHGPLSLELFNREHWKMDPAEVARIGKDKMLAGIAAAGV
jgi:2-keto-myo-inositol isomerase